MRATGQWHDMTFDSVCTASSDIGGKQQWKRITCVCSVYIDMWLATFSSVAGFIDVLGGTEAKYFHEFGTGNCLLDG